MLIHDEHALMLRWKFYAIKHSSTENLNLAAACGL
jgi:hypothetical protein